MVKLTAAQKFLLETSQEQTVLAVHPNHVVDAAHAAASRHHSTPEIYGPHRIKILLNYIESFKSFIQQQVDLNNNIIVTLLDKPPASLDDWYDPRDYWQDKVDLIKQGMEQEEVYQAYQDLMDFIHELNDDSKFHVVEEHSAGDACRDNRLQHILGRTDEVLLIGGNLTGCLDNTLRALKDRGLRVHIIERLTFDDNPGFWGRFN